MRRDRATRTTIAIAVIAGVALGVILAALIAAAANARTRTMCQRANTIRPKVIRLHGKRAPGRDICRWGMRHGGHPSKHQRARYLRALRVLVTPPKYPTLVRTAVPPPHPPAGTQTAGVAPGGTLQRIAQCESGGDPNAVSANGKYTGVVQFDDQTWHATTGLPGRAKDYPASTQYKAAAKLYAQRGAAPWPVCGR